MDFLSVFFISYILASFLWLGANVMNNVMHGKKKKRL